MASLLRTTSQRVFAMDLLHVLAFLCAVGSCLAGECLAEDEASSECLGLSFIQTYAQSSRVVSPSSRTKERSSAAIIGGSTRGIQEPETKEGEESEEKKETEKKDEKKEENKGEEKEEEKPEKKDEKQEAEAGMEKAEENPEKAGAEKVEEKSEEKSEETVEEKAEETEGDKAEEEVAGGAEAKSEEEPEEKAGEISEGKSEGAAEGAPGAEGEESGDPLEQLHGWLDRIGVGHAVDELEHLGGSALKNKKEYFDLAKERYGEYKDHKKSTAVLAFMIGTPAWFSLFCLWVMCCSSRDRDIDYSAYRGGMTEKLSDHSQRDGHLGIIGRTMEAGWFRLCVLAAVLVDIFCLFVIGTVQQTDWLNPKYKVQGDNWANGLRDVNIMILCGFLAEQFLHSITHGKLFFRHIWYILDLVGSYVALVAGCVLIDLYPANRLIQCLELLPLMRLWNVVAIILDLLLVTALAVEHEDEEVMKEEAYAEEVAKEEKEGLEVQAVLEK
mmetsp:Transcript_91386/g.161063  ORF Transcript_91386/g.161063 Transcript_91386/m.161063 type:complete len:499 (+) Transcript_91386:61-1557(+)